MGGDRDQLIPPRVAHKGPAHRAPRRARPTRAQGGPARARPTRAHPDARISKNNVSITR